MRAFAAAGLACAVLVNPPAALAQTLVPPPGGFLPPLLCPSDSACRIQHYVDQDPLGGASDYTCGHLTYDGHNGTDFAVADLATMQRGVNVVAAAAGIVTRVHDGEPDISMDETGPGDSLDSINGNSVTVAHEGGWHSTYAHLRRGSVKVVEGQEVEAGMILGQVGLSGNSNFPHLHFTLRYRDWIIDPFTAEPQASGCSVSHQDWTGTSLWAADSQDILTYQPGGLLAAGFATIPPSQQELRQGMTSSATLPAESRRLTFWISAWGLRRGDREWLQILRPDGIALGDTRDVLNQEGALWVRHSSLKSDLPWPRGIYRGLYRVERDGPEGPEVVINTERQVKVE